MQTQKLLKSFNIKAEKRLGQNFILKKEHLDLFQSSLRWRETSNSYPNSLVVEIGAGPATLSKRILKSNPAKLISVEIDERFTPFLADLKLSHPKKFDYILGDALNHGHILAMIKEKIQDQEFSMIHIVGNLPFEISGELLSIWNQQSLAKNGLFGLTDKVEMSLIFSKNMGEKLLPTFNKRTRFSTITQTAFDVHLAGIYPRTAFSPVPACDAIGLKFLNRKERLFQNEKQVQYYINFLKTIYNLPNKTIGNACSKIPQAKDYFGQLGIASSDRVFMVPIHLLVQLSKILYESQFKL